MWGQCVSVWVFDAGYVKTFEIQHCDSSGEHICPKMEEEKGPGMGNAQTVVSMRCAAHQRNVVRQSNYALKAINGAGNDIIA